jgi:nucleoside-diphosphate-sugar epimerase
MPVTQAYQQTRVLLLGGSGFIGRWVGAALTCAGANLVIVARDRGAAARELERCGVSATLFEADLERDGGLAEIVAEVRPSIAFNLAGYGVDPSERSAGAADVINKRLVAQLARLVAANADASWRGQHVVHAGSALEYGQVGGVVDEDTPPNPTTLYGQSKLGGTESLKDVCRRTGLRGLTARLFMVYGPGEHENRLLPQLLRETTSAGEIHLTTGQQARDFTYVEDVAEGLLRLGLAPVANGTVVNLATGRLTRVRDFVETAAAQLGIDGGRLRFGSLSTRPEEMTGLTGVSISRLRSLTDWSPPTTIEEGIRRTVRRHRELGGEK